MGMTCKINALVKDFLDFRLASGFSLAVYDSSMADFAGYCANHYPNASSLTQDMVLGWLRASNRSASVMKHRASVIRAFGNYLRAFGTDAYVLPFTLQPSSRRAFVPYIPCDEELQALFSEIDRRSATQPSNMVVRGALSVLFRLVYSCGLRPNEGRCAKRDDVDVKNGTMFIRETKYHKQRTVAISKSMSNLLEKYLARLDSAMAGCEYLFPKTDGRPMGSSALSGFFRLCWRNCSRSGRRSTGPRLRIYDLRHRFASEVLARWVESKRNIYSAMPILRIYMGHDSISSTLYYIHLLPDNLRKSSTVDWGRLDGILPEVQS